MSSLDIEDEYRNETILQNHTGVNKLDIGKRERAPLFKPTRNLGNVYGTQNPHDRELERYIASQKKQNELPFEKIMVGPGLDQGYTATPSGGFNQSNTRDYVLPKSVDELRVKTNPKLTFKGRTVAGKAINDKRGKEGELAKTSGMHKGRFFVRS